MAEPARPFRVVQAEEKERERQRLARFQGFYWGSDFIGFVVATFFTVVLFGIVGAIVGTVGYQLNAPVPKVGGPITQTTQNLGIGGLIGGLIALFIAYFIGGYVAGRMARFSGARQGVGVVIWTVVIAILLGVAGAILGTRFNVASQLHLNITGGTALTTAGLVSLVVALVVMLIAGVLGGTYGVRYHRHIDQELAR